MEAACEADTLLAAPREERFARLAALLRQATRSRDIPERHQAAREAEVHLQSLLDGLLSVAEADEQ